MKVYRVYLEARRQGTRASYLVALFEVEAADQHDAFRLAVEEAHRGKLETRDPLRVTEVTGATP